MTLFILLSFLDHRILIFVLKNQINVGMFITYNNNYIKFCSIVQQTVVASLKRIISKINYKWYSTTDSSIYIVKSI